MKHIHFLASVFRGSLFLLTILFMLLLPASCLSMDTVADSYFKNKFEKEIRKDNRFEGLFCFERTATSDFEYNIGIKFKDGRKMIVEAENSIYNINSIIEIENYRISILDLYFHGDDLEWSITYREGISYDWMVNMVNKKYQSYQFDNRLNCIVYYYDEIKELIEKIYNEGPIPGPIIEERNIDINELDSKWGDEEELKKYTGYYNYNEHRFRPGKHILKWKLYAEYIDNERK